MTARGILWDVGVLCIMIAVVALWIAVVVITTPIAGYYWWRDRFTGRSIRREIEDRDWYDQL